MFGNTLNYIVTLTNSHISPLSPAGNRPLPILQLQTKTNCHAVDSHLIQIVQTFIYTYIFFNQTCLFTYQEDRLAYFCGSVWLRRVYCSPSDMRPQRQWGHWCHSSAPPSVSDGCFYFPFLCYCHCFLVCFHSSAGSCERARRSRQREVIVFVCRRKRSRVPRTTLTNGEEAVNVT